MLLVSLIWRYSEVAITRRTRNAFVGSSRHKGSNPFISAFNQEETTAEFDETDSEAASFYVRGSPVRYFYRFSLMDSIGQYIFVFFCRFGI